MTLAEVPHYVGLGSSNAPLDHEVVPGCRKSFAWMSNSSWDHFGLHHRKHIKVTIDVEVSKTHLLRPT